MKPIDIRCAATPDGSIESCYSTYRLTIDRQTGAVINANVRQGSDEYRWLVQAARKYQTV